MLGFTILTQFLRLTLQFFSRDYDRKKIVSEHSVGALTENG